MTTKSKTKVEEIQVEVQDLGVPYDDHTEVVTPPSVHTTSTGDIRKRSSFGRTFYYIDTTRSRSSKGPGQMKGLVKWMLDNEITSPERAMQGSLIGESAVADGYVVTAKLTGAVIFAYYIRKMEQEQGVEHRATIHNRTGKHMA